MSGKKIGLKPLDPMTLVVGLAAVAALFFLVKKSTAAAAGQAIVPGTNLTLDQYQGN